MTQKFYIDYPNLDCEALLSALVDVKIHIVDQLNARSNTQLYRLPWYGKHTLRRMIQLNNAAPCKNAAARVQRWRKVRPR